jgi:glycosyltransferase involved in cell wall biosynthesis
VSEELCRTWASNVVWIGIVPEDADRSKGRGIPMGMRHPGHAMRKFSVIIPTFNRSTVVGRAIDSVLSQTCRDFEIIVVDDGATDDTEAVLRPYLDRIRYIRQANRGSAAARNRAIRESQGRYIAFLDSDDLWRPDKLARMEEAISAHPDAGVFYSDYEAVTADGRPVRVERCRRIVGDAYAKLLLHCFVLTSTVVCKRECFDACGFFHESLRRAQDWDLWIRMARRFSFVHVRAVLADYTWEPFSEARASRQTLADLQCVVDRSLEADSHLGAGMRRRILARLAYAQGVEHLRYGRTKECVSCFWNSFVNEPLFWKSLVYLVVGLSGLAAKLPYWMRVRLRIA